MINLLLANEIKDSLALKLLFFGVLRVVARKLPGPFGNPTQVSTQVQLASTCYYLTIRLAKALFSSYACCPHRRGLLKLPIDKSRYFEITEFNSCFNIRSSRLFLSLSHSLTAQGSHLPFFITIAWLQLRMSRIFAGNNLQVTWWALGQRKGSGKGQLLDGVENGRVCVILLSLRLHWQITQTSGFLIIKATNAKTESNTCFTMYTLTLLRRRKLA